MAMDWFMAAAMTYRSAHDSSAGKEISSYRENTSCATLLPLTI
jgi:hypothetical protein